MLNDLTGLKFNRLLVIKRVSNTKAGKARWLCKCDCGKETIVIGSKLTSGWTKSCGCLAMEKRTTHDLRYHPLHSVWSGMKQRCYNPKAARYERYGGRGITVCEEWKNDFKRFHDDMLPGYESGLQLDRIDNNKGYCKDNCRWVTPKENVRKTERAIMYQGLSLAKYCEMHGLNYKTVYTRIHVQKWPIEKALINKNFKYKRSN